MQILAGVYYANYLKFIERARSEIIKSLGFSNTILREKFKLLFIVKYCNINYRKPAKLEDELIALHLLYHYQNLTRNETRC